MHLDVTARVTNTEPPPVMEIVIVDPVEQREDAEADAPLWSQVASSPGSMTLPPIPSGIAMPPRDGTASNSLPAKGNPRHAAPPFFSRQPVQIPVPGCLWNRNLYPVPLNRSDAACIAATIVGNRLCQAQHSLVIQIASNRKRIPDAQKTLSTLSVISLSQIAHWDDRMVTRQ